MSTWVRREREVCGEQRFTNVPTNQVVAIDETKGIVTAGWPR